ncbi:glycosyltransferase [Mucilaginibacter sp. SJ]|uniref:glycosyltransferase n=1 Tax=Mucilaginibacter sp. SJ TaxID=3029053 RepID=UPI0023A94F12|nr:glycosyltransferase [Mucilaginibacter sp. SJ]WEA01628.1 glycosyltransferase [Mucilaginibacter sp. SJ]
MEKKIKILFGMESTGGGSLKHLIYLITHLDREIFDMTLMYSLRTGSENEEIDKLKLLGINIIRMQMPKDISFSKDMICLFKVTSFLMRNKFDIVHAHSSKAGFYFRIASLLNKVPTVIYTPHCFYYQSKSGMKRTFFELLERGLGLISDKIVVSENERLQGVRSRIAPADKFVNINNAIDFNDYVEYERETCLKHLGLHDSAVVIGSVGRLVKQKDMLTLIWAAGQLIKEVPDLYFIIAGMGEEEDLLQAEIAKLGLLNRVLLVGWEYNIDKIFSAIDIFVSTSLWEGLPYVILEAMFYKKPIVATDIGYQHVLVDNESCYLVPVQDVLTLCEKLKLLVNDRELRHEFGKKNRINFDLNFSFKKFVKQHEQLYLKLFNKN